MTSSDWPLQKAVFALLDGDSTLDALIGNNRIFDRVPDEQAFEPHGDLSEPFRLRRRPPLAPDRILVI